MPVRHLPSADLRDDLHRLAASIVWAVLTPVDRSGRPRGRIVHPVWSEREPLTGLAGSETALGIPDRSWSRRNG